MRLVDLDPEWWADEGRYGQGISFTCPHCHQTRIKIAFARPDDGMPPSGTMEPQVTYGHGGGGFENMTVSPRIWVRDHGGFLIVDGELLVRPVVVP